MQCQFAYGAIEHLPDAMIAIDNRGTLVAWNRAMEDMTGVKAGDVVGRDDYEYALPFYGRRRPLLIDLLDEPLERVSVDYRDAQKCGDRLEALTEKAKLKGKEAVVWALASKLYDREGHKIGAAETIRDVTRWLRAEDCLKRANDRLEAYLDLMGHDIINMNQVAVGYLGLVETATGRVIAPVIPCSIESVKDSSELIYMVKRALLADKERFRPEALDLGAMLAGVAAECSCVRGRKVHISYRPASGQIVMSNRFLKDVFSCVIGNAIRHSTGPLNIRMTVTRQFVDNWAYYRVAVEDDGKGMPDEVKYALFSSEPGDVAVVKDYGLQLYIVSSLACCCGSKVCVEDRVSGEPTKGSRFVIWLPAA